MQQTESFNLSQELSGSGRLPTQHWHRSLSRQPPMDPGTPRGGGHSDEAASENLPEQRETFSLANQRRR